MGVDYSAVLVVGFRLKAEEIEEDISEYCETFCHSIFAEYVTTGSCYSGDINYYIVPEVNITDVATLQEALEDLPRLKSDLNYKGIPIDDDPVISAELYIY